MDIPNNSNSSNKNRGYIIFSIVFIVLVFLSIKAWSNYSPSINRDDIWMGEVKRGDIPVEVYARGEIKFTNERLLATPVDGVIERILVNPGQAVERHQPLIKMVNPLLEEQLENSQFKLLEYEKSIIEKQSISDDEEIEQRLAIKLLEVDADVQKSELDAIKELYSTGIISKLNFRKAQSKLTRLNARLEVAKEKLKNKLALNAQKKENNQLVYENFKAKVNIDKRNIDNLTIISEIDGVVIDLDKAIKLGQHLTAGQRVGVVSNIKNPKAILRIPYYESEKIKLGMDVTLKISSSNYFGKTTRIDPQITNDTMTIEVSFVGDVPKNLRNNMNVEGVVITNTLKDVLYIDKPVGVKVNSSHTLFMLNQNENLLEKVVVQFGEESSKYITVNNGLQESDTVILSNMNDYLSFDNLILK